MKKLFILFFFINIVFVSHQVFSKDKALLIGVDIYQNGFAPLVGVSEDIRMMKQVAKIMGFDASQIITLTGQQASLFTVQQTMKGLANSLQADDKVLIYFSGHGSQIIDMNQDEKDGADEVLLLSNSAVVRQANENTLVNVLVDDDFRNMLTALPSKQVIAIIDACHSGTIHKAFILNYSAQHSQEKLFRYKGMPTEQKHYASKGNLSTNRPVSKYNDNDEVQNYIVISASHDDEPAISTEKGSLFTRGIFAVLQRYHQAGQAISLNQLQLEVSEFIKKTVQLEGLSVNHTPQVHGNPGLLQQSLLQ